MKERSDTGQYTGEEYPGDTFGSAGSCSCKFTARGQSK